MANKHVRRCSRSFFIRKLQIKTMRCHNTYIRIAKVCTMTTPKANEDVEQQKLSLIVYGDANDTFCHFGRHCSTKLNILLLYNPAITLPDIYPKELKMYLHKTHTWMLVSVLFIGSKTWGKKQYILQ